MAITLKRQPTQNGPKETGKVAVPVKITSLGALYVDSSVSAISPQKLKELIQAQVRPRGQTESQDKK